MGIGYDAEKTSNLGATRRPVALEAGSLLEGVALADTATNEWLLTKLKPRARHFTPTKWETRLPWILHSGIG